LVEAREIVAEFHLMIRLKTEEELIPWIERARASLVASFANGVAKAEAAVIPDAMLLCASSPYARRGALWDAHRRHFGKDGDPTLVWQAPTRKMNPTVPQRVPALTAGVAALGWAGANMTVGTTAVAALVGGSRVFQAISKRGSKAGSKN
jgi:hypothetical protein